MNIEKRFWERNKPRMLNFCSFPAPVKSLPPGQFMWANPGPPRHDFWSNVPGLPGGMVTLGIDSGISEDLNTIQAVHLPTCEVTGMPMKISHSQHTQ